MRTGNKLMSIFGAIDDTRNHINKLHDLVDILLIGIISVICGVETWKQMVEFANLKGKKSPVHMVSAWANENSLVLSQVKVNQKSNEITAIPELIEKLMIEDCIVTIDAMETQTNIAEKIIDNGAEYILAVKKIKNITGVLKQKQCRVIFDFIFIENKNHKWKNLKQVVKIESLREFKNSDKAYEKSIRCYISSLKNNAKQYQQNIRSHWGVENKLHRSLDVRFYEDASRKRNKNTAQNYSILLKIALNLLKNEKTEKQGIDGKRLKAGWNQEYLLKVLDIKV